MNYLMEYYMEIKPFSQVYARHSLKIDFFNRPEIYPNTLLVAKSKSEYMIRSIPKQNEDLCEMMEIPTPVKTLTLKSIITKGAVKK